ncbi:MAG TPA: nitronate monooxygenase [Burkholderiaceae bacterium]|nr:nitronate monooxygenase [Burkholderiaceae bacterium]
MIDIALTRRFGPVHPIVLGPMGGVCGGRLAAVVSNADGPGLVGGGYGDPDCMRTELATAAADARAPGGVGLIRIGQAAEARLRADSGCLRARAAGPRLPCA